MNVLVHVLAHSRASLSRHLHTFKHYYSMHMHVHICYDIRAYSHKRGAHVHTLTHLYARAYTQSHAKTNTLALIVMLSPYS